ncbi:methyl farnesoate epoxidase-like [Amphibalanus amphitrite]|uniref:methyl farnesoate epoxidase-like n=1 Tax=Amphibalanus amphitrite TaxID=1232801 RepID=UPI001C9117D7|nr:methyl farnesoate epoxidase-like [Amphibalanus amphitrite]
MAALLWLGLALSALLAWVWVHRPKRPANFPPGPPCVLVFGSLSATLELFTMGVRQALRKRRRLYGDINGAVSPTGLGIVNLCSHELIREASAMPELSGRPEILPLLVRSYMKKMGIIFNDGAVWREQRRFALRHLRDLGLGRKDMEEGILGEFEHLRRDMELLEGRPLQVLGYFNLTALNILWRVVASTRIDPSDPEARLYVQLVKEFFEMIRPTSPLGIAPWLRHIVPEWSGFSALERQREVINATFLRLLAEHRATLDRDHPRDLMDHFLIEMETTDAAERGFTELNLAVTGMDLFIAGMETTSTQLSWALLYMASHPAAQRRVQAEVDRELGGRRPSGADRARLPLTDATLMEVMRRATVLPRAVPHAAARDCHLAGYSLPRGTVVLMDLDAVHMDANHWGDPDKFRPERFLREDGSVRRDEHLMPFGVGRRFCLGEPLARAELLLLFVSLLQHFTFEPVEGETLDLDGNYGALLPPHPFRLICRPRAAQPQQ